MDATVIYKQLDDYRSGKRSWGVMGAIASALRVIAEQLAPGEVDAVALFYSGRGRVALQ